MFFFFQYYYSISALQNDNEPRQFINYYRRPGVSRLFKSAADYNADCDRNTKRHNANNYTNSISIMTHVVMLQYSDFMAVVVKIHLFILCVTLSTFEIFITFVMCVSIKCCYLMLISKTFSQIHAYRLIFIPHQTSFGEFRAYFTYFFLFSNIFYDNIFI